MKHLILTIIALGLTVGCAEGPRGDKGVQGEVGAIGPSGSNGQDGTQVTMVKFCNESAHYPSVFPEYGILIGSNLYAVYSTHGGFLALIPPGYYSSNAVGSSCNFTVNANGQISH